jgi:archaellum component FlaG (FlaF/FlaG flagellin family)
MLNLQPSMARAARKGSRLASVALLSLLAAMGLGVRPAFATIDDTVVASGNYLGAPLTSTATKKVDVADQLSSMLVSKTGTVNDGGDGHADVGDTISYVITVKNTGNVTLKTVTLSDPLVPPGAPSLTGDVAPLNDSIDTAAAGWDTLAPGDTLTYTALYTLQQAEYGNRQRHHGARPAGEQHGHGDHAVQRVLVHRHGQDWRSGTRPQWPR